MTWSNLLDVRIISATPTMSVSLSGSTIGRVRRTIIAFGIFTIDVLRIGEDQMTTNGTRFKGEVPMTHLGLRLKLRKSSKTEEDDGESGPERLSAEVGAIVGGRGQRGLGAKGLF